VHSPQAILENVVYDSESFDVHFSDRSITENTRGSYPLSALTRVFDQTRESQHPTSIVFLSADAFGALPAVAKLDADQAEYYFLSGYTAKVAGTEMGVKEPQATFSTCFGAPFMPRRAAEYAALLRKRLASTGASVWLLNTGWTRGGFGVGQRFPIATSRTLLRLIQNGELHQVPTQKHPVFGFEVPTQVPGVDSAHLDPQDDKAAKKLAALFKKNALDNSYPTRGGPL
jgi:phosphoenolpyruvate carboxykinase (ATP)